MREIKTVTGEVYAGKNSKFEDRGEYIEQINMFSSVKIYKKNIVSDTEDSREAIALAATVAIAVATGGTIIV